MDESKVIEVMKLALEVLEDFVDDSRSQKQQDEAITVLRQALQQPADDVEQSSTESKESFDQPVACPYCHNSHTLGAVYFDQNCVECVKRMTRPQSAAWVGLTDEEATSLWNWVHYCHNEAPLTPFAFARAIEAKLKEKNGGLL